MTTTTEKLSAFINRNRIRMTSTWADTNPHMASDNASNDEWMRSASHWRCTFRMGNKQLTVYFSQGSAISGEPKAEDVLDCLASDAAGIENAPSFEEWAGEYGYDTDSRKAERTFKVCEKQAAKLKQFLGDEYETLLWNTERL